MITFNKGSLSREQKKKMLREHRRVNKILHKYYFV